MIKVNNPLRLQATRYMSITSNYSHSPELPENVDGIIVQLDCMGCRNELLGQVQFNLSWDKARQFANRLLVLIGDKPDR